MVAHAPTAAFNRRIEHYRGRVEVYLQRRLTTDGGVPEPLAEAMRYAVLAPGKRIRPLLSYASAELFGLPPERVDAIAASVELLHAYSLIHDDLPAMDDDDLRRGRPATHRQFGEALAILAGDALQALAFEVLCQNPDGSAAARLVGWLARAAGPAGMVGGQVLDLHAEGQRLDEAGLADIHRRKTGALIRAAIMMPGELAEAPPQSLRTLDTFATRIGLVFQIRDDLLEVDHDTTTLGKSADSDAKNDKATYPGILGIQGARQRARDEYATSLQALNRLGDRASGLQWIADYIVNRSK